MAPESYDNLPEGFVDQVFHKVTDNEIKAPLTKFLTKGSFQLEYFKADIAFRLTLANQASVDGKINNSCLTENEFLSTSDLS